MSLDIASDLDDIYKSVVNDSKDKIGIICLNCLLKYSTLEDLKEFIKDHGIDIEWLAEQIARKDIRLALLKPPKELEYLRKE